MVGMIGRRLLAVHRLATETAHAPWTRGPLSQCYRAPVSGGPVPGAPVQLVGDQLPNVARLGRLTPPRPLGVFGSGT